MPNFFGGCICVQSFQVKILPTPKPGVNHVKQTIGGILCSVGVQLYFPLLPPSHLSLNKLPEKQFTRIAGRLMSWGLQRGNVARSALCLYDQDSTRVSFSLWWIPDKFCNRTTVRVPFPFNYFTIVNNHMPSYSQIHYNNANIVLKRKEKEVGDIVQLKTEQRVLN